MKLVLNPVQQCGLLAVLFKAVEALSIKGVASTQLREIPPTSAVPMGNHSAYSHVHKRGVQFNLPLANLPEDAERMRKNIPVDIPGTSQAKKKRLMDAINKFRAEICAKMKQEHKEEFDTFEKCKKFMDKACRPGKDDKMDGDKKEISSGEGYCKEYFPEAERKAREQIDKEDQEKEKEVATTSPPAPKEEKKEEKKKDAPLPVPKEEKKEGKDAAAPAPAPAPGPSGAPGTVDENFIPGKNPYDGGSKKRPANIADDEAYYFKKDGKDMMARLHMDEDLKLPAQGYWGKLIEHDDMQTMTEDWGKEFGPSSGGKSLKEICAKHPESSWCYGQYGHVHHHGTGSRVATPYILPFVIAFVTLLH